MRKLVIIPTYNEKENISAMISKVFSLPEPFDMLVIDTKPLRRFFRFGSGKARVWTISA